MAQCVQHFQLVVRFVHDGRVRVPAQTPVLRRHAVRAASVCHTRATTRMQRCVAAAAASGSSGIGGGGCVDGGGVAVERERGPDLRCAAELLLECGFGAGQERNVRPYRLGMRGLKTKYFINIKTISLQNVYPRRAFVAIPGTIGTQDSQDPRP